MDREGGVHSEQAVYMNRRMGRGPPTCVDALFIRK